MLIALLSDVHGNQPAFEAVLDDVDSAGADEIWCLGDLVGYGAQPDECAAAAQWTQENIAEDTMTYLRGLKPADEGREPALYHASPRDHVWEYVLSGWQAEECMDSMDARVAAIGHSHVALWFHREDDGTVSGDKAAGHLERDLSGGDWLVNPGGVGQPRDGDPRAAWLLLDTDTWKATWRRVEYPIDEAAKAIEEAGLPRVLAERLYSGQ